MFIHKNDVVLCQLHSLKKCVLHHFENRIVKYWKCAEVNIVATSS